MSRAVKTAIKFHSRSGIYSSGDIAAFPPEAAKRYVEGGVATYFNTNPPVAAESAPDKPKSEPAGSKPADEEPKPRQRRRRVRQMESGRGGDYETKEG